MLWGILCRKILRFSEREIKTAEPFSSHNVIQSNIGTTYKWMIYLVSSVVIKKKINKLILLSDMTECQSV